MPTTNVMIVLLLFAFVNVFDVCVDLSKSEKVYILKKNVKSNAYALKVSD